MDNSPFSEVSFFTTGNRGESVKHEGRIRRYDDA